MKTDTTPRPFGDFREPEKEKRSESFRLDASTSEKLARAAEKFNCSKTFYIELALKNQFEKDRITE